MAKVVGGQFSHNRECLCLYSEPHGGMPVMCDSCVDCCCAVWVAVHHWSCALLSNGFIASFRQTHFWHFPRQKGEQQHPLTWCCDTATVYLFLQRIQESLNLLIASFQHCVTKSFLPWTRDTDKAFDNRIRAKGAYDLMNTLLLSTLLLSVAYTYCPMVIRLDIFQRVKITSWNTITQTQQRWVYIVSIVWEQATTRLFLRSCPLQCLI